MPKQFSSSGTGNPWILHLKRCAGQFKMTLADAMKSPKIRAMYTTRALVKIRPTKKKAKVAAHSSAEKPQPDPSTAPNASTEPTPTASTSANPPSSAATVASTAALPPPQLGTLSAPAAAALSASSSDHATDAKAQSSPSTTPTTAAPSSSPAKPVPHLTLNEMLDVKYINDEKQWGVVAKRPIEDGEYIGEYTGQRINGRKAITHAHWRSEYVFALRDDKAIDAEHADCVCKYLNHSRFHPNIEPKRENRNSEIHFYATRPIDTGEELLYDYGDRSADSLKRCPWLAE